MFILRKAREHFTQNNAKRLILNNDVLEYICKGKNFASNILSLSNESKFFLINERHSL